MPEAVVPEPLDPESVARREFSKVRRGYDPVEVKAQMLALASEISRLRNDEESLRRRLDELQRDDEHEHSDEDDRDLTRLLGEETVRIVEAARVAASEIRQKAEANASRLVKDAQDRAARTQREADELRVAAATDADELVGAARLRADEMVNDAREAAAELTATAEAEAARLREKAEKATAEMTAEAAAEAERLRAAAQAVRDEADEYSERLRSEANEAAERRAAESERAAAAELEAAREQGREMVREAKGARERMLRDLAERRRVARQQLEALRAGRERLLEAFSSARDALDDATSEVADSLPAARVAADDAARLVDDDIDEQVAELAAELDGAGDAVSDQPGAESISGAPGGPDRVGAAEGPDGGTGASGASDVVAGEGGTPDADEDAPHLRLVASNASRPHLVDLDDGDDDLDDDDLDDDDDGDDDDLDADDLDLDDDGDHAEVATVDDLFARLRSGDAGDGDANDAAASDDSDDADGGDAIIVDLEPVLGASSVLNRRDAVLSDIERQIARRLKRHFADRENGDLDQVRRHKKGVVDVSVLGDAEGHADDVVLSVATELAEAVRAGSRFLVGPDGSLPSADPSVETELADAVRDTLATPFRERLERVLDELGGVDRDELADAIRAWYREWKNDRVPELAGDLATRAFNRGILLAAGDGARLCWVVDHGGLPCPDAEDNRLAGEVEAGAEYPTGVTQPPAHPGCRCLLVAPEPG